MLVIDEDLIRSVTRAIVERFDPERVIVFGSHARGEAELDSDLDLFVEMESSKSPGDRIVEIRRSFGIHPWPMDLVVYTPEEVERLKDVHGTLLSTILREGRTVYDRREIDLSSVAR